MHICQLSDCVLNHLHSIKTDDAMIENEYDSVPVIHIDCKSSRKVSCGLD